MAFVPLVLGFLAELGVGAAVAETVSVAVGSEAVGSAVGGAAVGAIAKPLADLAQQGAEGIYDSAFGPGASQAAEEWASKQKADFLDAGSYLLRGDYEGYMKAKMAEKRRKAQEAQAQVPANTAPQPAPQTYQQPLDPVQAAKQQLGYDNPVNVDSAMIINTGNLTDSAVGLGQPPSDQTNQQTQQVPQDACACQGWNDVPTADQPDVKVSQLAIETLPNGDQVITDKTQTDPLPVIRSSEIQKDPESVGHDLGRLISLHTTEMMKPGGMLSDNPDPNITMFTSISKVAKDYPSLAYLIPQVIQYYQDIDKVTPDTEMYRKLSAVYTGKPINQLSVQMRVRADGLHEFAGLDETGRVQYYLEHPGGLKIPPIHGVWVGPYSYNNSLPIDLFDTYAFYHDVDYHNGGFFDLNGDYKFISRLSQNMDRFPDHLKPMVKGTIIYFSTVGHTLASMKSSLYNESPVPLDSLLPQNPQGPKEIYDYVYPGFSIDSVNPNDPLQHLQNSAGQQQPASDQQSRDHFYEGLVKGLAEETSQTSIMAVASRGSPTAVASFDSMLVQLV